MFGMGVGTSMCLVRLDRRLKARGAAGEEYEKTKAEVMDVLRGHFRPEFLNRIDEVVMFNPLGKKQVKAIVEIQLKQLADKLKERDIELIVAPEALEHIATVGFDPQFGARPVKRVIQKQVLNLLSKQLLAGDVDTEQPVVLDVFDGQMVFRKPLKEEVNHV